MIHSWPELKALALGLNLPEVTDTTAWANPCLKAHGKMWCWWSPYIDAAVFKASRDEREMLMAADPDTFTLHPHYLPHNLILVRAGRIDAGWASARLIQHWRDAAPKRWLRAWDAANAKT
ncbi:MAG: MmcQ/YjbR family DNA-binding protein [Tabrizicola sp.]